MRFPYTIGVVVMAGPVLALGGWYVAGGPAWPLILGASAFFGYSHWAIKRLDRIQVEARP